MSPSYHPGFSGIHILYLRSKIIAARVLLAYLLVAVCSLSTLLYFSYREVSYMSGFNHVVCPDEAIATVIESTRAICVMRKTAPGELTYPIRAGWLDVPRGRKKK